MQKKLGRMLIEAGLIDEYALKAALKRQKSRGGLLGSNLVLTAAINEDDLLMFLAQRTGVATVTLDHIEPTEELTFIVTEALADRFDVVPIKRIDDKTIQVACADPTDLDALDQLQFLTGKHIVPVIATHSAIYDAINRFYRGVAVSPKRQ